MEEKNLFIAQTGFSDGNTVGPSQSIIGEGHPVVISLYNPSGGIVQMQMRPVRNAANLDPMWSNIGGVGVNTRQRFNLFLAGYEYRAFVIASPKDTSKMRFTVHSLDQVAQFYSQGEYLINAFAGHSVAGFALSDDNDYLEVGDLEALKTTNAPMFFHMSADPAEAFYNGLWERESGDYVKVNVNEAQLYLTTALISANTTSTATTTGGTDTTTPTTSAGDIGQVPVTRTSAGTRTYIDSSNAALQFQIYSSNSGEVLWPQAVGELADDYYEVTLNGIVVAKEKKYAHTFTNLQASADQTATVRLVGSDGQYSDPVTITARTPATGTSATTSGTTGTGTTTDSTSSLDDGTQTDTPFVYIDGVSSVYDVVGQNGQRWVKATNDVFSGGSGYVKLQGASASSNGAINYYQNLATDIEFPDVNRHIWVRARITTDGDKTIAACSHGNGLLGLAVVTQKTFEWVLLNQPFKPYDRELQLLGRDTSVEIDGFVLIRESDNSVPTGKAGFKA